MMVCVMCECDDGVWVMMDEGGVWVMMDEDCVWLIKYWL